MTKAKKARWKALKDLEGMFAIQEVWTPEFLETARRIVQDRLRERADRYFQGSAGKATDLRVDVKPDDVFHLGVKVQAFYDFGDFTFERRLSRSTEYKDPSAATVEELRVRLLRKVQKTADALGNGLVEGLSSRQGNLYEAVRKGNCENLRCTIAERFQEKYGRTVSDLLSALAAQAQADRGPDLEKALTDHMRETAGPLLPSYFEPGEVQSLRFLVLRREDYHVTGTLSFRIIYPACLVERKLEVDGGSLFPVLRTLDRSSLEEFVRKLMERCVQKVLEQEEQMLWPCQVRFPSEMADGDTPLARGVKLLREGEVRIGGLDIRVEAGLFVFGRDRNHIFLAPAKADGKPASLPFTLAAPEPGILSLPSLMDDLDWLAGIWAEETAQDGKQTAVIHLERKGIFLQCGRTRQELKKNGTRDEERARQFIRDLLDAELEPQRQKDVLNGLNEVQVQILKQLYKSKHPSRWGFPGMSRQAAMEKYGKHPQLTRSAIGGYLEYLSRLTIPYAGRRLTLLTARRVDGQYGEYTSYERNGQLARDLILQAKPRPLGPQDFPDMSPEARDRFLEMMARDAMAKKDREKSWQVLSILENDLPRAAAVRFVKSEEGQAFLQALQGPDRDYARLFLEDLPGCKRLVHGLLPEESPQDE